VSNGASIDQFVASLRNHASRTDDPKIQHLLTDAARIVEWCEARIGEERHAREDWRSIAAQLVFGIERAANAGEVTSLNRALALFDRRRDEFESR
jgi:hypothetical protein